MTDLSLNLPEPIIEWIYEGTDPSKYEYDVGSVLNRAPKQIEKNVEYLAGFVANKLIPYISVKTEVDTLPNNVVEYWSVSKLYSKGDLVLGQDGIIYVSKHDNNASSLSVTSSWEPASSLINLANKVNVINNTLTYDLTQVRLEIINNDNKVTTYVTSINTRIDDLLSRISSLEASVESLSSRLDTFIASDYLRSMGTRSVNFTAEPNASYILMNNMVVTLPSNPQLQQRVELVDGLGTLNNVVVKTIDGNRIYSKDSDSDLVIDVPKFTVILTYTGNSEGWIVDIL